jgi:hypothetical protein
MMSEQRYMPPVSCCADWPLQQNGLLQLIRRKRMGRTLIQPGFDALKCVFVHIPKAAGTSVKKTLFPNSHELTHYRAIDYLLDSPIKYRKYFVFAFSRNPYDRLVSGYEYLMQGGKNQADRQFRDSYLLAYSDFEEFVKKGFYQKAVKQKYHFVPQHVFISNPFGKIIVDFLGRFENIEEDFAEIAKRIGVDARLPHSNSSARKDFKDYYSEDTRKIAYNIYKRDFEMLGYDPEMSNK